MANEAKIDDKSMGSNEINAAAKDEGDSFITCEEGNENSGNLSEEVMNDVEDEEEEALPINQVFRSSKRKSRKANFESDSDESKGYDFACATLASGKGEEGSQTRARKRSKYLSYPYYTDGYLKFIVKDSKIPKQLRECIAQEDSKISKVSSGRKFNRKPCKNPFDSSNESEAINMSCHDLLSLLQMAAIDSHHPNKTKSFDSIKVFFSMFRKSVFHDESSIGLSSMNTIQQMDVPESSVAVRKPCSFDLSSPKVLALYSPRYLAQYSPKTLVALRGAKTRKVTGISRKDAIFYSSVADKTNYLGLSSPIVKSEPKRNRKQEITMDKPEPKIRNRTTRPKLMSLNDVAMESADIAKLNNLEPISLVIDLPIDPEPRNDEKKSDALLSMNTDLGSVIRAVDGSIVEDGKKELPSEEKSGRKRRGRKKKSLIACQTSCATDVQNLNKNVVETISQGKDAPKDKRGRKKRVIEQNAVMIHQNGTSDCTCLNRNEVEPVSLGNEAEPVLMGNVVEPVLMRNEAEPLSLRNEAETISLKSDAKPVLLENEVEPGLLGNEAKQLSLGKEAELGSLENMAKVVLLGNHLPEAKQEMMKKSYPVSGGMPPLSIVKQNLQTMTTMLAKTSDKVPEEMKTKLKEKIERLIVKVNTREGSSSS